MTAHALDIAVRGLNAFLMIAFGLALGAFVARRWKQPWGLFGIGAVTFVLSQAAHIPFNSFVLSAFFTRMGWTDPTSVGTLIGVAASLGLSAGVFEEGARLLMFRFWARKARRWEEALMIGAGHGGIEAVLLGLLVVYALDPGAGTARAPTWPVWCRPTRWRPPACRSRPTGRRRGTPPCWVRWNGSSPCACICP